MTGFHHHTYVQAESPGSYFGPDNAKAPTPLSAAPNPLGMVGTL